MCRCWWPEANRQSSPAVIVTPPRPVLVYLLVVAIVHSFYNTTLILFHALKRTR